MWEPQGTELLPDPRAVSLRSGSLAFLPAVDEASGRPPRPFAGCCCLGPLSARSAPELTALNGTGLVGTVLLARVLWCLPRPCRTLSPRARACEPVCKLGKVGLQLAVPPPPPPPWPRKLALLPVRPPSSVGWSLCPVPSPSVSEPARLSALPGPARGHRLLSTPTGGTVLALLPATSPGSRASGGNSPQCNQRLMLSAPWRQGQLFTAAATGPSCQPPGHRGSSELVVVPPWQGGCYSQDGMLV